MPLVNPTRWLSAIIACLVTSTALGGCGIASSARPQAATVMAVLLATGAAAAELRLSLSHKVGTEAGEPGEAAVRQQVAVLVLAGMSTLAFACTTTVTGKAVPGDN